MALFHEKVVSRNNEVVSAVEAIYVPSDDLLDAGVQSIYPYLDSTVSLSRDVYQRGIFPAVDILASNSSIIGSQFVGKDHYEHEHVVHGKGILNDVAGKELGHLFKAQHEPGKESEQGGHQYPEGAQGHGLLAGDFVRAACGKFDVRSKERGGGDGEDNPHDINRQHLRRLYL